MQVEPIMAEPSSQRKLIVPIALFKKNLGKAASTVLFIAATVVAIAVLTGTGVELFRQSIQLNLSLLILSCIVVFIGLLVAVFVWHQVLSSFGIRQPFRVNLRMYSYSLLGAALPGRVWPLAGRSMLYQRMGVSGLRVATASVIEACVIGVAAMAVYAVSTFLWPSTNLWTRPEVGIGFSLLVLVLIYPPVFNRLSHWAMKHSKRTEALATIYFQTRQLFYWLILEGLMVIIGATAFYVLLSSFVIAPISLLKQMILAWAAVSAAGNLFFWLPATSFLRDGAFIVALTPSVPLPVALVFVLLARIWSIASTLIIVIFIWLLLDLPSRRKHEAK